jgi:hypothetical protein
MFMLDITLVHGISKTSLQLDAAPGIQKGASPREDMSFECLFFAEVITTPIALLIMGCIVRHWRLLILPLFTATWIGL